MEEAPGHWEPRGKVEQAGGDVSLPGEESGPALRCQVQRPEPRLVSGPQGAAVESRRGGPRGQRTGEEAPRGQPGAGGASRRAECPRAAARRRPWCQPRPRWPSCRRGTGGGAGRSGRAGRVLSGHHCGGDARGTPEGCGLRKGSSEGWGRPGRARGRAAGAPQGTPGRAEGQQRPGMAWVGGHVPGPDWTGRAWRGRRVSPSGRWSPRLGAQVQAGGREGPLRGREALGVRGATHEEESL